MVETRWAGPDDIAEIGRISAHCFPGDSPAERAERIRKDPRIAPGDILVAESGGRIAGGATLIPQRVWTGGVDHPVGGVASVQVDPDQRRKGIAQIVMERIFEAHRERGYALSLLYPYRSSFYRRLGYATIEQYVELRLRTGVLPQDDGAVSVRTATAADVDKVIGCHERSLPLHNGGMARSRGMWENRVLNSKRTIALYERGGRAEGYLIYELAATGDGLQQLLRVREWVAPTAEAQRALLGYLLLQQAQSPETQMFASIDCPLLFFLAEPRSPQYENPIAGRYSSGETGTAAMGKVTDLAGLFGADRPFPGPPLTCTVRTVENAGIREGAEEPVVESVTVDFDGKSAALTRSRAAAMLECDPGVMAQIWFGAVKPSAAVCFGAARVDSTGTAKKLDSLFAQPAPFFHPLDYF